jgi:RNA polymerase primary sigma factor
MDTIKGSEYNLRNQCRKASRLTNEENLELVRKAQNGDKEAMEKLILHNGKLVDTVIKRHAADYYDNEDIFQQGLLGLMTAIERFDFSQETTLSTYSFNWIRSYIGRYISECEESIRIPSRYYEYIKKMKASISKYIRNQETSDMIEYIANDTNLPVDTVKTLMPYIAAKASLDANIQKDSDDSDSVLGDFVADDRMNVEEEGIQSTASEELLDLLGKALKDKEKDILCRRFGITTGKMETLEEIGEDYGVTRERVRQIEERALKKLKHPKYRRLLKDYVK